MAYQWHRGRLVNDEELKQEKTNDIFGFFILMNAVCGACIGNETAGFPGMIVGTILLGGISLILNPLLLGLLSVGSLIYFVIMLFSLTKGD